MKSRQVPDLDRYITMTINLLAPLLSVMMLAVQANPSPVRVTIDTAAGEIEIEVDLAHAPVTAANFLKYVDAGLYDGGRFHRTVKMDNQPNNDVKGRWPDADAASRDSVH